jgi:hypothetical protein
MLTCSHIQISGLLCNDVEISATSGARVLIKAVNRRDDTYIISNGVHLPPMEQTKYRCKWYQPGNFSSSFLNVILVKFVHIICAAKYRNNASSVNAYPHPQRQDHRIAT